MVPWHEAAEFCLALRSCGVPAKHLIYDTTKHNDFVLDWQPLRLSTAGAAAAAGAPVALSRAAAAGSSSSNGGGVVAESLPAFARDLLAILTGATTVRFETGSVAQTAAAVAALERAAGLPQAHSHTGATAVGVIDPQLAVPRPLSRL